MLAALKAVEEGVCVSKAARDFDIPRSTLYDRVRGKVVHGVKPGPEPYLSQTEEKELGSYLKHCAKIGYGKTRRDVLCIVESAASERGKLRSTHVSDGWWRRFKERQGDLSLRQGDSTAHVRMDAMNRETIDHYFMLLRETLTTHGLMDKPSQIYNVDESGVPLNPRPPKIVTTKGRVTKKVRYRTSGRKGQVTVVGCANASGQAIPPMIIYDAARLNPAWTRDEVPGTKYGLSSNGWINTDLFEAWFLEHFLENAVSARPLFLLLDGHSTHYQPQVIRLAVEHNCIILCLPPHTTHEAQPLDVGVFAPLKVQWTRVCHEFYQKYPGSVVTKFNFSRLFSQAWCLAVTPVNIISGFRRAGVYPLDRNVLTLTEVCNPPTALESEALSSSNTTTVASVINVEITPVSTMPSAAHTDLDESADVPAGTSAMNTQLDSAAVSVENLSAEEVERFERRYNEGFDLPDPVYQAWVKVHHPDTSTSPLTSKGLEPSLAELFSAVPPQSPVTLDVRLTPVSSSGLTSSGVPSSGSTSSGVPSSGSTSSGVPSSGSSSSGVPSSASTSSGVPSSGSTSSGVPSSGSLSLRFVTLPLPSSRKRYPVVTPLLLPQ